MDKYRIATPAFVRSRVDSRFVGNDDCMPLLRDTSVSQNLQLEGCSWGKIIRAAWAHGDCGGRQEKREVYFAALRLVVFSETADSCDRCQYGDLYWHRYIVAVV
ncbi:hypothetical protein EVAR_71004_1 [Eumeta japonica]|uniref:Uncharacterized protein n=1 Tax=Eumeta variegata TaxID=151549 RepID=A0A4C1SPI6_EUMVA|nr:hypothetical protein EVAR_71004_1 [Eumeta japonica]